jgi:hypothetical protein
MEPVSPEVLDALFLRPSRSESDSQEISRVFWKAYGALDGARPISRMGINWTSDDDPILSSKAKAILYQSGDEKCTLLLSHFYNKAPVDTVNEDIVTLELFSDKTPADLARDVYSGKGDLVFSIIREGAIESPLGFIDASIANSIVDLFLNEKTLKTNTT